MGTTPPPLSKYDVHDPEKPDRGCWMFLTLLVLISLALLACMVLTTVGFDSTDSGRGRAESLTHWLWILVALAGIVAAAIAWFVSKSGGWAIAFGSASLLILVLLFAAPSGPAERVVRDDINIIFERCSQPDSGSGIPCDSQEPGSWGVRNDANRPIAMTKRTVIYANESAIPAGTYELWIADDNLSQDEAFRPDVYMPWGFDDDAEWRVNEDGSLSLPIRVTGGRNVITVRWYTDSPEPPSSPEASPTVRLEPGDEG